MTSSMQGRKQRLARFLSQVAERKCPLGLAMGTPSAELIEMVGLTRAVDWLLFNLEHTVVSGPANITTMCRAAELFDLPAFVKLSRWDPLQARDAFDAGACGVQVPFVSNAQQMRDVIHEIRRPSRGVCAVARASGYGVAKVYQPGTGMTSVGGIGMPPGYHENNLEFVEEHALIIPLIETVEAMENLDEIMAASDSPIICFGATDFWHSYLEATGQEMDRPLLTKVMMTVSTKVHAQNKHLMFVIEMNESAAAAMAAIGIDVPYSGDVECLVAGVEKLVGARDLMRRVRDQG